MDPRLQQVPYPQNMAGQPSHPGNHKWGAYANKLQIVSLLKPEHFCDYFGFNAHQYFSIRDKYVAPMLAAMNHVAHVMTADSITGLYLLKMRDNNDFRILGRMYECEKDTARLWFNRVRDSIQIGSPFLDRIRNLGNNARLRESYLEISQATQRSEMLYAVFSPLRDAYAIRVGLNPADVKLAVVCLDGLHCAVQKSSSHEHFRRLHSGKLKKNGVVIQGIASLDAKPQFIGCMTASISPANTDERIAAGLYQMNANGSHTGGLRDWLMGPMKFLNLRPGQVPYYDFFIMVLLDRGYKVFGNLPAGVQTFIQMLQNLSQVTNGRVQFRFPPDPRDDWFDQNGVSHPPPQPHPGAGPVPRDFHMDITANSGSVNCTKGRGSVEILFNRGHWQNRIFERGNPTHNALLRPYNQLPCPDKPILVVLLENAFALLHEHGTPMLPSFTLPPNVTRADCGRKLSARIDMPCFLDPFRYNLTWRKPTGIFNMPSPVDIAQHGVNVGNLLDCWWTQFPQLTEDMLREINCGTYQTRMCRGYATGVRAEEVVRQQAAGAMPLNTIQQQNAAHSEAPQNIRCFWFDQIQPPMNWPNNVHWEPCRILSIPNAIPSKYTANKKHWVVLAYVPITVPPQLARNIIPAHPIANPGWPINQPALGTVTPEVGRILNWCCGPRQLAACRCIPGARQAYPCAHNMCAMYLAGRVAYDPATFITAWDDINVVDCGARTDAYNEEIANDYYN
jgi:hypothetical protein